MKKILIVLSCIIASTSFCNSQLFIGGSVSINAQGGKTENNDNSAKSESTFSFNLSPQIGFQISEKMDVGAYLAFGHDHTNNNLDPEYITNELLIGFRPFLRYYAFNRNKFSMYGEFAGLYDYSVLKSHNGDIDYDDEKTATIGLIAYPGMSFKITEKVKLMAIINLFGLGVVHSMEKTGDTKERDTNFHLGVDMQHILTTGSISIGAIYRFN